MNKETLQKYSEYFDFEALLEDIRSYLPKFNEDKFVEAFEFAERYHRNQKRKSGEPYILHPVETVKNLVKLRVDEDTLIAGLLHDVPEDTEATLEQIENAFGESVAFLVSGITKLSKVYYQRNMAERQIESLKKLLIHTAKDPRVIIMKLADRLHNMRTLEFIDKPEKRLRISKETLEIYVPIANLLGIQDLKGELEDLCFKYIDPEAYEKLYEKIHGTLTRYQGVLDKMIDIIKKELKEHDVDATVYGREKSLYSIYKKVVSENKSAEDIHDRLALRIITKNKPDCYTSLGVVHDIFNPKPGRFKDYIAVPKVNGYKSIHTTVFGVNGLLTEIQIRTKNMHIDAEYGIAAHYFYDDSKMDKSMLLDDQRSSWTSKILELQKSQEIGGDFMSGLKIDIFQDRIFVFTPGGETIDLPKNATAIDFAYAIHSEVGNHAFKAMINNDEKPITTALKTGDLVNIVTSDDARPDISWMSFAKTHSAREKIRQFLKKETYKNKVSVGVDSLQKELLRNGMGLIEDINFKKLILCINEKFGTEYKAKTDLFEALGDGSIRSVEFIKCLRVIRKTKDDGTQAYLKIIAEDRKGLLRDLSAILVRYNVNILSSHAYISALSGNAIMLTSVEFASLSDFSEVCQHIEQIEGVKGVIRLYKRLKVSFYSVALTTIAVWALHPFFITAILNLNFLKGYSFLLPWLLYIGMFMLLFTVVYLRKIIQKSFPTFQDVKWIWITTFSAATIAVFALLSELYILELHLNWLIIFVGISMMYGYLTYQYVRFQYPRERG
ncbi:RelA/SpoT family protein [Candidatus Peregrinibacteria bacterium]|nr:RelA/SpoT family protein [Candidatus Peregrinibacteria bacterium]MBT4055621.1 RelA/SpoT family protein [Candidatus Peregrinibacteria bacterium]